MNSKIKQFFVGIGLVSAMGLGGAAVAGAQGGSSPPANPPQAESAPESGAPDEKEQKVTGADADRAGKAALDATKGGKVIAVERETHDPNEKPEPGEKETAKERSLDQNTAYSVEVQTSDGKTADVALDSSFSVLDVEQDSEGQEAPVR